MPDPYTKAELQACLERALQAAMDRGEALERRILRLEVRIAMMENDRRAGELGATARRLDAARKEEGAAIEAAIRAARKDGR